MGHTVCFLFFSEYLYILFFVLFSRPSCPATILLVYCGHAEGFGNYCICNSLCLSVDYHWLFGLLSGVALGALGALFCGVNDLLAILVFLIRGTE